MRKLTGAVFSSLDGVMQAPGGPEEDETGNFPFGGWSFHFWDENLEAPFGKIIGADYDLLLGKRTYDIFAGYWPSIWITRSERPSSASTNMCSPIRMRRSNGPTAIAFPATRPRRLPSSSEARAATSSSRGAAPFICPCSPPA